MATTIAGRAKRARESAGGQSLIVWSVALLPYNILITIDNSFTFQSAVPSLGLMILGFLFGRKRITYSRFALAIMSTFVLVTGIANGITLVTAPEMVTSNTLVRAIMVLAIVWYFATIISYTWDEDEVRFVVTAIALSLVATVFLEIKQYVLMGAYGGRVYPNSLVGHKIDANFFALLVVLQISCAMYRALFLKSFWGKLGLFILVGLGVVSIMLTGSRSGLLCSMLVVALQCFVYYVRPRRGKLLTSLLLLLFLVILLISMGNMLSDWMFNRFFVNSYDDGSNQFRVELWGKAVGRWASRPLFGYGVGNYNYFSAFDWGVDSIATTTHGTLTDFLVDFGIVGLSAFVSILAKIVLLARKAGDGVLLAAMPGISICWVIVGAERTVALWLFLCVFYVIARYGTSERDLSPQGEGSPVRGE